MTKHLKVFLFAIILLASTPNAMAQTVETEKTYEISGKAKRGYLAKVDYDPKTQECTLYFVTKANDRRIKFEVYRFDKEYNFIDKKDEEQELEKVTYKWFRVKKENYEKEGVTVDNGGIFNAALTLKRKQTTYNWSWVWGSYSVRTKILEKVKPKTDDGKKYLYAGHIEDDATGDIFVLASIKDKGEQGKNFTLLRFNNQLDLVKTQEIKFDYAVTRAFTANLYTEDEDDPEMKIVTGGIMIFAPAKGSKEFTNPDKNAYEVVKFDRDFNITRSSFKSPASYFRIDEMVSTSDAYYFYGVAAEGKDRYYNQLATLEKFKAVQLLKVKASDYKVEYITSANLDEMQAKLKTPPSQKRKPEYRGNKFETKGYFVTKNNEFVLYGQNFEMKTDRVPQGGKMVEIEFKSYRDVIGFYFDTKGVLKAQYGIDPVEDSKAAKRMGAPQYIVENTKGNAMYWILTEIDGFRVEDEQVRPLAYPRIAKINTSDNSVKDFITMGEVGKTKYYLDKKYPYLPIDDGNKIVFFGSNKTGKTLYFGRVRLD